MKKGAGLTTRWSIGAMRLVQLVVALSLVAQPVAAQTNRGGISGTVFDATGAVLPGATVVVTNIGTNKSVTTTTSRHGTYSVVPLDPVTYRVAVDLQGFQKSVVEKVKVDTAVVATVDVRLATGSLAETVTVVAESPVVNSQSGTASQTISERQIVEMPLNNRSVLDLAMTVGNVSGMAGTEDPELAANAADVPAPGYNLFINGGRAGTTSILADGARNTGVGIARAVVSFSPDTVQEFTVQTSNFAAEFGQTGGGVINMTTKQGTNEYQGLAYWYNRDPAFAAAPFTTAATNRPTSNRKQNQVGFTLSGPIRIPKALLGGYDGRDRTFFFVAYEPRWYHDSYPYQDLLPTEAMRNGDFANLVSLTSGGYTTQDVAQRFGLAYTPVTLYNQFNVAGNQFVRRTIPAGTTFPVFANNQIPASMIDPTSQEVMKHLPAAGEYFIGNDGLLKNYNSSQFIDNYRAAPDRAPGPPAEPGQSAECPLHACADPWRSRPGGLRHRQGRGEQPGHRLQLVQAVPRHRHPHVLLRAHQRPPVQLHLWALHPQLLADVRRFHRAELVEGAGAPKHHAWRNLRVQHRHGLRGLVPVPAEREHRAHLQHHRQHDVGPLQHDVEGRFRPRPDGARHDPDVRGLRRTVRVQHRRHQQRAHQRQRGKPLCLLPARRL